MRTKRDITRISLNIDTELLQKIDNYASELNVPRTSALAFICNQYFQGIETVRTLNRACDFAEKGVTYEREIQK